MENEWGGDGSIKASLSIDPLWDICLYVPVNSTDNGVMEYLTKLSQIYNTLVEYYLKAHNQ